MLRRRKRKTKKKTRSKGHPAPHGILPLAFVHPMSMKSAKHHLGWMKLGFTAGMILLAATITKAQEPAPAAQAAPPENPATPAEKPSKKKSRQLPDFLIRGTIFNEKVLSFPGVEVRIRAAGEKKYHWEAYTNSRGEFAVRVPQGANYEMLVHVKGFADQTRTVDAKSGGDEETVMIRMQPLAGGQK
jgi:hypothetical protein